MLFLVVAVEQGHNDHFKRPQHQYSIQVMNGAVTAAEQRVGRRDQQKAAVEYNVEDQNKLRGELWQELEEETAEYGRQNRQRHQPLPGKNAAAKKL